jgi:hypothetical protein
MYYPFRFMKRNYTCGRMMISLFLGSILLISATIIIASAMGGGGLNEVSAQMTNTTPSPTNTTTSITTSSSSSIANLELSKRMADMEYSNNPKDIATLAYIWGFPLVTTERQFNFVTNPNVPPGPGRGPANSISCARDLLNASFTDIVSPNSDILFCFTQFDLKNEPVVIVVPPIADRYYSFAFLDAYTNVYAYIGQRATGTLGGGTYLVAGPDWNGQVPPGMTKIWSPTNLAWSIDRIFVKGPSDLPNVHAIQDRIIVKPLSVFLGGNTTTDNSASSITSATSATTNTTTASNTNTTQTNSTYYYITSSSSFKQTIPIGPQPSLIAPTGIKLYDEIGAAMVGNPPNPPDPALVSKLASIGIGPGKTPSKDANDTIRVALQTGITEGQKMIDQKVANLGLVNDGWHVDAQLGVYGTDYLSRAAITQFGFGANTPQEAFYTGAFTDIQGRPLSGANNYLIHFKQGQTPPVNAFWSITMYNNKSLFVDNPINRYSIGKYTEGLKNNTDGSLDIYVQHTNPGKDKESNWLPAPSEEEGGGEFNLVMRLYLPQPQVFNGTWQYPTVQLLQQQQ